MPFDNVPKSSGHLQKSPEMVGTSLKMWRRYSHAFDLGKVGRYMLGNELTNTHFKLNMKMVVSLTSFQNGRVCIHDVSVTVLHIRFAAAKKCQTFNRLCTIAMCSSRKYPYPPHGRSTEIPRGWGVSKAKIFKGKYGAKLEFPEGWGDFNQKTFRGRGMDIFWNYTMLTLN